MQRTGFWDSMLHSRLSRLSHFGSFRHVPPATVPFCVPKARGLSTKRISGSQQFHIHGRQPQPEQTTHFGYKDVHLDNKQTLVSSVFDSVADKYDVMNDLMSLRVHRLWKSAFVNEMAPTGDMRVLDCAGGTGDISLRILQHVNQGGSGWTNDHAGVTVCDINDNMLSVGRERLTRYMRANHEPPSRVDFVAGDAQKLPFDDATFDVYAISFGMRNVPQPLLALREAQRVLKPGGRFMMLEFGSVQSRLVSSIYDAWSFNVIPKIGGFITRDEAAYHYLVESIRRFPSQPEFLQMMRESQLAACTATDYSFGIAVCYSGFKLPETEGSIEKQSDGRIADKGR